MNKVRIGNFNSSEIVALMAKGKGSPYGDPFWTFIEECNMERRLGRSVDKDFDSKETAWGSLCEVRVFDILGTDYSLHHKQTLVHPTVPYWVGTPDTTRHINGTKIIGDIKCPFTLKSFCQLVDLFRMGGIEAVCNGVTDSMGRFHKAHPQGKKFKYQVISNACITGCNQGELIVYCPYKSELDAIRELASQWDGPEQKRFERFFYGSDSELPWLPDGGTYSNINHLVFDIPASVKMELHERVIEAGKYLIQSSQPIEA